MAPKHQSLEPPLSAKAFTPFPQEMKGFGFFPPPQPESSRKKEGEKRQKKKISSHFPPAPFPPGMRWFNPVLASRESTPSCHSPGRGCGHQPVVWGG